jgi:D-inositol-3-phosphate glycosyltransferase
VRVLLVSHYAPPHVGGLEAVVDALATGLVGLGHEVTVVSSTAGLRDGLGVPRSRPPRYRMIYVPAWNKFFEVRLAIPYPLFAPSLLTVLRREVTRADVVHVHGFLFQSTLVAQALARRAPNRPVTVLTEHVGHVPYENRLVDRIEAAAIGTLGRWSARSADAVVVFNAAVRDTIARLAPTTSISWIDNAVDTDFFRPASASERADLRSRFGWDDHPRVLFGGRAVGGREEGARRRARRHASRRRGLYLGRGGDHASPARHPPRRATRPAVARANGGRIARRRCVARPVAGRGPSGDDPGGARQRPSRGRD